MKLLFAHDHIFFKYNDLFYSTGGLSKEALERYTRLFNKVVIVSRQKNIETLDNKLTLASTENVEFVNVDDFKSIRSGYKILNAKRIINNEVLKCDVVIARLPSSIGSIAISCAKKNKKPYLVEFVACPWDSLWNHSIKGKIVAPFAFYKSKRVIKTAPYVIYVTNEFLQNRYPTKGKNTNCSNVSLKELDDHVLGRRVDKITNMQSNQKVILGTTAAVNVRSKGQQYIIKALSELKKIGITNFEYQLVGGGDQDYLTSIALKNNVEDQVKFLGPLPHDKVFEWLEAIDIYIQPSRQEGLPRALIEAMSQGAPCFGAKTAGIPELLDSKYIFSNTRHNIQEICNIIMHFSKDDMLLQAKRNYVEAKKYDKAIIEDRRNNFFTRFINDIKS